MTCTIMHFRPTVALLSLCAFLLTIAGSTTAAEAAQTSSSSKQRQPVTPEPWQEAVVSVTDLTQSTRFFTEIGDYKTRWQGPIDSSLIRTWGLPEGASGEAILLGPSAAERGLVRLVRFDNAGRREPMRPGSRAWDTGCYFSLMIRMKDMQAVFDDAIALGWWTETPITDLRFGESKLKIVIYRGPDGLQVQGYERLSPSLPDSIDPFKRIARPFNMMQMVRDRDEAYRFYTEILGFDTFYYGKPYVAKEPEYTPLGIPRNLTTEVAYKAGITYPVAGEYGRMEMIEIIGLEGRDYADRCHAPNLGILAVRFEVEDAEAARALLQSRGAEVGELSAATLNPYGNIKLFEAKTPDGAIIQFYER
ncbi:MAG: VOC family protein [Pseudomonadota bacterium]